MVQKLKKNLGNLLDVDSEGWVPCYKWDAARAAHEKIYAYIKKDVEEKYAAGEGTLSRAELKEIRPFDDVRHEGQKKLAAEKIFRLGQNSRSYGLFDDS